MPFNHINLCASDVKALRTTLEQHFGYRTVDSGTVPNIPGIAGAGGDFAMLVGEDDSNIVITHIDPSENPSYPPGFHFGLIQDSVEAVHLKHRELTAAGFSPGKINGPFEAVGAHWTAFYCPLGDGLEVEINHRTRSDILDR